MPRVFKKAIVRSTDPDGSVNVDRLLTQSKALRFTKYGDRLSQFFGDAKAADEAKAKLAMSGFVAQVQPVTINGKTWHRVRLGPYSSASELESAKRTLAGNGISAIALKEQPAQ